MKIVKLLRMGALLAAAIAFVGCEMTLSDEDSRKEVVEAKAKANAASGSDSGGGSTGTVDGTYASYGTLVAGSWNTADGTIGALNGISETTGLTVSFHIDNAMTSTDQVVLFTNSDATCGITNGYLWPWASANTKNIGVNDAWLGSSYGVIKEACVANSLYTVVFGTDGGVYFYVNGEMIGNGWCESVVTDSDAWAGVKNFNKTMVNAAAGGLKVLHDMASLNLTMDDFLYTKAMSKDEVKAMYDAWKKGKSPAPTTDNSSQGENTGTNNSGNNGNNNSGNTENNNNSGNSGNGQSGESGTGTTVQNTVTGEGTIASPYVLKTTVVETYNGVESINAFSVQSTKGFDASAKIIWDNPLKNSTANAVTVSAKIYCPSVDGVNGFDSLIAFFKSANASNNNIAENSCLGIYEGGAIHGNDWAGNYFDDKSILVKGEWVRVTIVISSEGVTYYHGNTSIASPAVTGNASAFITSVLEMDKVAVGVGGIWPAGYVDNGSYISNDIKIYSTALTAEQVAAIN